MSRVTWKLGVMITTTMLSLALTVPLTFDSRAKEPLVDGRNPQIGRSFAVPYRLPIRVTFWCGYGLNGKGPFNFLVDSGAGALHCN